jgi:Flp pilus assembly protein TadD
MITQNSLELRGDLLEHPFAELVVEMSHALFSGSLRLSFEDKKTIVYFEGGRIVFAVSNSRRLRLLDVLKAHQPDKVPNELPKFENDLQLLEYLRSDNIMSSPEIDRLVSRQLSCVIQDVLSWTGGEWRFDPLARARSDVRAEVDLGPILLEYARSLPESFLTERFRSFTEMFAGVPDADINVDLLEDERLIMSRLSVEPTMVSEIISQDESTRSSQLKILYSLWLAGLITRSDWAAVFSESKIAAIRSANLVLKKSAAPISKRAPEQEIKPEPAPEPPKPKPAQPVMSLDSYLKRVESAASLYDVLGLKSDCSIQAVRNSYFNLAKQFHPDRFHRSDQTRLRRVENAFSTLAQAYETLKDVTAREFYDSKLKRERSERASVDQSASAAGKSTGHSERAAQEFEHGRGLLMDGDWEEALPFLARSVHFVPDNARYHAFYGKALSNDESQRHQAVNSMQKAVTLDPQNAAFRMMLAEFLVKVNLIKRAEGELTRLLSMQPDNKEARSLLDSISRK